MKIFTLYRNNELVTMELSEIETLFEKYIISKAYSAGGKLWLENFSRGGLATILLIMHFIYDRDWLNATVETEQEEELFHYLTQTKQRVYKELSL